MRSRLQDDLDAAVLLVPESLVQYGALFERGAMRDDERGVDFALLDALQQFRPTVLHRRLGHAKGGAAVDRGAHRDLVEEAAVNADDRYGAEVAATVDRLPEDMRPVGAHEGRHLDAVDHGVETGPGIGFGADRVDAGIGAAA